MRKIISIVLLALSAVVTIKADDVHYLTQDMFCQAIYDYRHEPRWKFLGEKPCIVDFYTTWCGPCKRLAPIFEDLAQEYCDQVMFYKVDAERELELAHTLGIRSYPTVLIVRADGKILLVQGLRPRELWVQIIEEVLLGHTPQEEPQQ